MINLMKKRLVLPACICCLCAPSVLLASPGELDEITIRVIDNDDILPGSHALILPVNEEVHGHNEHNKSSRLESTETERTKSTSAEHDDGGKKGYELNRETEHSGQHDKSESRDELEHPEHQEYTKELETPEHPEELESPEQPEQPEELESPEQPEQPEELEAPEQPEELESPEQPEQPEELEQPESTEYPEKEL